MKKRDLIFTRREMRIYNSLKKKLENVFEILNNLVTLNVQTSFILVSLNDIKLTPFFLKEIRKTDFVVRFPYEQNVFLIIAQNNTLAQSFDFMNRMDGVLYRKYFPNSFELKFSILNLQSHQEYSSILFEILILYKKLKKDIREYKKL